METTSISVYIYLGTTLWFLMRLPEDSKADVVINSIRELKKGLEMLRFKVSLRAGRHLWDIADELENKNNNTKLDRLEVIKIREAVKKFEHTLISEADGIYVYTVSEKRIDSEKLLNKPAMLLSENIWKSLPNISARDWSDGCKAIAFKLPTGAAFYLLRCVEGALRHLYLCIVKQKRLPENKRMWGPMVTQLMARKTNKPPKELLDILDIIRINFRNPTFHPEKMYDIEEVQDLFGLCVDALNRMVRLNCWKLPNDSMDVFIKKLLNSAKKIKPLT